jgi:hypothetical protein
MRSLCPSRCWVAIAGGPAELQKSFEWIRRFVLRWQPNIAAHMQIYGQVHGPLGSALYQFEFGDLVQDSKSSAVFDQILHMRQEMVAFNQCHDISPERAKATLDVIK